MNLGVKYSIIFWIGLAVGLWSDRLLIAHGWTGRIGDALYATHVCAIGILL